MHSCRRAAATLYWTGALLAMGGSAPAQTYTPGPQVLTFVSDVDDSDQPYAMYVPRVLERTRKYPLVISLHGPYSNHRLNLRRVFGQGNRPGQSDAEATRSFPQFRDVDFLVASPLARGTMGYQGIPEKDIYDVLADVKKRFPVDEDRVYLTGLSTGGGGALWLGLTRPDVWAAIAPVAPLTIPGTEQFAGNALNLPIKIFQGENDPIVKVQEVRDWHKRLLGLGVPSEYVEYSGVRHNAWDVAYKGAAIFDWFAKHQRQRYPARVRVATNQYRYASAYWAQIDALTPGTLATLDARYSARNKLEVQTNALQAFTLRLANHPMVVRSQALQVTVDGKPTRVKAGETVSFSRAAGGGWTPKRFVPPPVFKKPGTEGPIADALASRHIYVYGTADSPDPEEVRRRRDIATEAANWSGPQAQLLITFRVVADAEVKDTDLLNTNLVLFGTRATNSLIARYAAELPMELNPSAADYGLLFVTAINGRYVVVSSGLPWWTRADQVIRGAVPFVPKRFQILQSFGDYILIRGGLDRTIATGRFDVNWKLPAEAAAEIAATGAVKVNRQ